VPSPDYAPQAHVSRTPAPVAFSTANAPTNNTDAHFDLERQRDLDEEQSGAELSYAARGQGDSNSGTPFYTGEA
jgi:hypothetical protein